MQLQMLPAKLKGSGAMNTNRKMVDLGFAREMFPAGTHMCLIYSSDEERGEIVARYLESGLKTGERAAHFADTLSPDELSTWLAGKGVALPDLYSSGQLSVSSTESTYHTTKDFGSNLSGPINLEFVLHVGDLSCGDLYKNVI
jgi:hypothetical protein